MHLRHAVRLLLCKRCSCAKKWRPLSLAISLAIRFPLFQSSNPKRGSYSLLYKSCRAKNIVVQKNGYGVATIIRLLKIIFLFCKRVFCTRTLSKRLYSAKETYEIKEPTNRSHSIPLSLAVSLVIRFLLFKVSIQGEVAIPLHINILQAPYKREVQGGEDP